MVKAIKKVQNSLYSNLSQLEEFKKVYVPDSYHKRCLEFANRLKGKSFYDIERSTSKFQNLLQPQDINPDS